MASGNNKPAVKRTEIQPKFKIRKGDEVIVTTGKDKGKKGTVTTIIPKTGRAVVTGINIVKKHEKPSAAGSGGIVKKEMPIHISNLAALDPKDGKPTKIGYKLENGKRTRIAKRSGEAFTE